MWWLFIAMLNLGDLTLESDPFEKQIPFIAACADPAIQYAAAFCGIQSGKTLGGADGTYAALQGPNPVMLPKHMRGKTPIEAWMVSKSYALCETQLETFRWRTPPAMWASDADLKRWGLTRGDRYTHWLKPSPYRLKAGDPCPIKLRMRTAKDPESMRATPVLGLLWGDEAAYWPPRSVQNAMGRAIVARTKFIFTTSPRGKDYLYRTVALPGGWPLGGGSDAKIAAFGWSSADNPYADKDHLARLHRLLGREYAKQELEGLFTDAIGYVYGMFDRTVHMRKPPSQDPNYYPVRVGGIDPGIRDPYAAGIWCRDKDGCWWQTWEFHETGQSSARLAPLFKIAQEQWKVKTWYVDKRRPSDIMDLRDAGIRVLPNLDVHFEADARTVAPMVAYCRELMRAGKLYIDENHEWTAEEFEKYHYPDEVDEREKNTQDTPVDWMNHHMDQMRYAICSVDDIPSAPPRYRQGKDQVPRSLVRQAAKPFSEVGIKDYIAAQDKRFDEKEKMGGRQERRNRPRSRMRFS